MRHVGLDKFLLSSTQIHLVPTFRDLQQGKARGKKSYSTYYGHVLNEYRKYWKVSRAYFKFLKFFCGFTFKLIYYLEVIL